MKTDLNNLKDLLIEQLRELYNAEKQQIQAFEELFEEASAKELKFFIRSQLEDIRFQIQRLDKVFMELGDRPAGEISDSISTLIKNSRQLVSRSKDKPTKDAALIAMMQYMKHYEIAGYGSTCAYANELGLISIADQLHKSLIEEKETDGLLTKLAFGKINEEAIE